MQTRLGMIKNISVSRGTANLPFTNRGNVTSIDVTFTVEDLSSLMHMPISNGSLFQSDMSADDDNLLQDYLAVLAGMDVYSQVFMLPKAKIRIARTLRSLDKITSPAYWASFIHEETTSGLLSYIMPIGRVADIIMPGSTLLNGSAGRV